MTELKTLESNGKLGEVVDMTVRLSSKSQVTKTSHVCNATEQVRVPDACKNKRVQDCELSDPRRLCDDVSKDKGPQETRLDQQVPAPDGTLYDDARVRSAET